MKSKPPKGYTAFTAEESRVLLSALNCAILTLDHFTFLLEALELARPEQTNRLDRAIKNLKKLRRKLDGAEKSSLRQGYSSALPRRTTGSQ